MITSGPLRILCLEDNPLIAFHVEQMIEDLGHLPVLTLGSFAELQKQTALEVDCALIDIDLVDGRTGPDAAKWLKERQIPGLFVTGQYEIASHFSDLVRGILVKPISTDSLGLELERLSLHQSHSHDDQFRNS